ncbi:MAG: ankyrin repeat domain-containing protein [Gammaproteobacteria bacterium]|nr:ankyrin repeat domain-containing protein [Gammaproteobacteria bacterium]
MMLRKSLLQAIAGVLSLAGAATVIASDLQEDAKYRYPDGSTPLQWAVYDGDTDRVKTLLKAGADVNATNNYGANAMQLAAEVADTRMLKLLLDAGANADSPNPEGQTALMLVARTGNVDAAKLLVKHGATVDAREGWGQQTALMWASARRHPEMMAYLIAQGADINARSVWRDYQRHLTAESRAKNMDSGGLTPLLYAARENCLECVKVLLKNGVDKDLPDPDRVSPLLLSIINTNWDIAKLLIEAGADVNQWDIYGQAPLFAAAMRQPQADVTSIDTLNETNGATVVRMLLDAGANPNMQLFMRPADLFGSGVSRGTTPLHAAVANSDPEIVSLLIERGAEVNRNDADNESALMLVMQRRDRAGVVPIIETLVTAGADVDANALYHHLQRTRGGTPLHYAVRAGNNAAIEALVKAGAEVNQKDPDGLTALDYAMARGYIPFLQKREAPRMDLAKTLRASGATVELPEEPYWPPVGPPIGYEATIWPL